MYKNLLKVAIFAIVVLAIIIGIAYHFKDKPKIETNTQSSNVTATETKNKEPLQTENKQENIHGQVIYDTSSALPSQAVLNIKLTESSSEKTGGTVIAEINVEATKQSPLEWTLPVAFNELDPNKNYSLQAKISSGDTLLFVNDGIQALDQGQTTYVMRLAKIDGAMNSKDKTQDITGKEWGLVSFSGQQVLDDSSISLFIDNEAKADVNGNLEHFRVNGSGGCNRFMGSATISKEAKSIQFSPLGTTYMACVPNIMEQETRFIGMTANARYYQFDAAGDLYLLDSEHSKIAHFKIN